MRCFKIIVACLILLSVFGIPIIASAKDVVFTNHSSQNLQLSMDPYVKRAALNVGETLTFSENDFSDMCKYNLMNCTVLVHKEDWHKINELAVLIFSGTGILYSENHLLDIFIWAYHGRSDVVFTDM